MTRAICLLLAGGLWLGIVGCRRSNTPRAGALAAPGAAARPIPGAVLAARLRLRAYDTAGALALLGAEKPLCEAEAERSWLLAHLWRERTEGARARSAAEAMPPGTFRSALAASLAEDPRRGVEQVRACLRRGSDPWLHLAAAYLHSFRGDTGPARSHARRALGRGWTFVDVEAHLVLARTLVGDGQLAEASRQAARAAAIEPTDSRAWFIAAEAARRGGAFDRAVDFLAETVSRVTVAEGPPRRFAEMLRQQDDDALFDHARTRLGTAPPPGTRNPERIALHGLLADREERNEDAIRLYESALSLGADPIPLERDLRRLLAARGDYARVVELLVGGIPPRLLEDARNLVGPAWREVRAASADAPDRGAGEAARIRLAKALTAVGAVPEARAVLDGLEGSDARALAHRLAAHAGLTAALGDLLERGYRTEDAGGTPPGFDAMVTSLRDLARAHLPPDEAASFAAPATGARRMSFLGSWLDHSTDTTSPVVAHFRRYGTYLVFGQREGQPVEAVLLSLASLTKDQVVETRGHRFHQDVAIGYDRRLRSFHTALGGDLGGACLPDGIWMDADSTRSVEHGLARAATRDPERMRMIRRGPRLLPMDTPVGPFELGDPAGVGLRLALRYLDRRGGATWGSFDTLRAHEFGHLVEIRRHLPVARGLGASAALFLSSGLSLEVAERELERRAQVAALAESTEPDLALAEMLVLLPVVAEEPPPHDGGYQEAARQLVRHVYARADLYPQIDRRHRILPQLDRLTNDQIRRAARAILPR